MKSLLKYFLFIPLLFAYACGNTTVEKEKMTKAEVAKAPMVKEETAKPVLVENTATETTTIQNEKADEKVKSEKVVNSNKPITTKTATKTATNKTKETAKPVEKTTTKPSPVPAKETLPKPVETPKAELPKETPPAVTEPVKETPKAELPKATFPTPEPKEEAIKPSPPAFSHDAWNALAQKHISSSGKVNYKGFKADIAAFDAYLKSLAENPIQNDWSRGKKMAYWINAYNAFTIKLIVDNYPLKSIMDLDGGKPWDKKWIKLGGKTYSLNNIEHDILRPQFKDARIHFAVNCAAKSCPPVWNKAWTAENLNGQLERSAKAFINNAKYNQIDKKEVAISKIFEWYAVDFGNIIDYLNKYAANKINSGATVNYKDYYWALNE